MQTTRQRFSAQQLWRLLVLLVLAVLILECTRTLRGDISRLSALSLQHSWGLLLGAALLSLGNYGLRIVRWRYYLMRLGHTLPLRFTALTYVAGFAFTVSPGKVGEMARARYYERSGIPLSAVTGAFGVERLLDVLAMAVLAALLGATTPRYHVVIWTAAALVAASLALLVLAPWTRLANSLSRRPSLSPRISRAAVAVAGALVAARRLLRPGPLLLGFTAGLAAWAMESLGLGLLASMFPGPHLTAAVASGIYAVAMLVGAISFLPGGLGSTEAVMSALLASQGYPLSQAVVITLGCRLVTLWLAVGCGWLAVLALRERRSAVAAVPWQ